MIPDVLNNATYGFMSSHVLYVADELGVFDRIISNKGDTAENLANWSKTTFDGMERLLLAATAAGLLEKKGEIFQVPDTLQSFLQKSSPNYLGNIFSHYQTLTMNIFRFLKDGLFEGKPQWSKVFGKEVKQNIFDDIYADQESLKKFVESMWAMGITPARELMQKYPMNGINTLIDIGGCSGSFAIAALENNPELNAIVFDLPKIQPFLENKKREFNLEERLSFRAGDFFKDELPKGDAYSIGYILSDWTIKEGTELINKIYHQLPEGGRIFILEKLFNNDKTGPLPTAMMNLAMFLETWGKHYSAEEYTSWLEEVGFKEFKVVTSNGDKHMIVGVK